MTDFTKIDQIIESLQGDMVETLRKWLRVRSLKSAAAPGAPFGEPLREMLEMVLADCRRLGFETKNYDGYAGDAKMGEGGDAEALGILAHVDVVPAGDGWKHDPFGAALEGDFIYGRGAGDDKGPLCAALFAMHAVRQAGIHLNRKVTLIVGCDEESGMEDMKHYREVAVMPRSGFSPDATYPLINLEKGMCGLELSAPVSDEGVKIIELNAGTRTNVIPGAAEAVVAGTGLARKVAGISQQYGWPVEAHEEGGNTRIRATGINGHAAYPDIARNAIGQLLITLRGLGAAGAIRTLADTIGTQSHGEGLGVSCEDGASGQLTCNLGILRVENGKLFATLDMRVPLLVAADRIPKIVEARLPGVTVNVRNLKLPHYVPETGKLVQSLLDAYHEVTGGERVAQSTGGGTYARFLDEGVAFGAGFPGEPDLAHQAEEYIKVSSLIMNMRIFARAIVKLAGSEA